MNRQQRSTRKRPRAASSCRHDLLAPQIITSPDVSRESFPALLTPCEELIPSNEHGHDTVLSRWHIHHPRNTSLLPRRQNAIVIFVVFALLWGVAIASNNTTMTSNIDSVFDRTESRKNAQLTFTRTSTRHLTDTRDLGSTRFDRLRFCSNLARRLCGKCSRFYKKLVKTERCKKKKCKEKFRNCMFGKSRTLVRTFNNVCDNRLKVQWPIKNVFGRRGRYRGRKFDYRKMRLVDWCRAPKVKRPRPRNRDDCGEETEYYAEMEVLLDLYCPVNEQNQPQQPQFERSSMERGFLQFLNSESACFGQDVCEQIQYDTSTIQELIAGEDCCPIYAAQNIACPTTSRSLISEEFDGSMESFEAVMKRQLQRRRKTKVKKRVTGRCRSRKKKCRRKEKRRRLEVSFDSASGSMSISEGDGGKVSTYSLRNGGRIDNGSKQHEEKNPLPQQMHVVRHLQVNVPDVNIGDLTPAECEALTLEESIRQQDPVAFRTITSTEEEEFVEYPSCQDPSSFECNSPLGGFVCCGKGQCKCDIGSNTRCEKGTLFGTTQQTQCYLNSDGLQGNIASRQDNLCCDPYVGPPISYRYDCSASICGPLPTAQCGRQPWINTIDSGPANARAGSFVLGVDFDIIDVCSATLANRNSIEMTVGGVVDTYVKNLIQYSGCSRSNLSENGVTVSSVTVVSNTENCPGNLRRLSVPRGTFSRELQSGTTCVDSATGQAAPSVTFSARITGQFRTYQPLAFPIEEGIKYDGFDPPAPAPSPGDENACSCDSLICKEVRDALANTAGSDVKNAGVTTTGIEIAISTPDPTTSPTKAPSRSPTKEPSRNPTSSVSYYVDLVSETGMIDMKYMCVWEMMLPYLSNLHISMQTFANLSAHKESNTATNTKSAYLYILICLYIYACCNSGQDIMLS